MSNFDPYHKWLGIPPEHQPPHHYRLLGIEAFEADPDVISNAADQRMAHVRLFQTGKNADLSQCVLNEIATAKICLLNPQKKWDYDQILQSQLAPPRPSAVAEPLPPPEVPPVPPTPSLIIGDDIPDRISFSRKSRQKRRSSWVPWAFSCVGGLAAVVVFMMIAEQGKRQLAQAPLVTDTKPEAVSPKSISRKTAPKEKKEEPKSEPETKPQPRKETTRKQVRPKPAILVTPTEDAETDIEPPPASESEPRSRNQAKRSPSEPKLDPEEPPLENTETQTRMTITDNHRDLSHNALPNLQPPPSKYKPGLVAELFNDPQFMRRVKARIDGVIDFSCASGRSPDIDLNSSNYSIRWRGYIRTTKAGRYRFVINSAGGVRMALAGKIILTSLSRGGHFSTLTYLKEGYNVMQIEFLQTAGPGECHLQWSRPDDGDLVQTITADYLFHDLKMERFVGYKEPESVVPEDVQALLGTWEVVVNDDSPVLWTFLPNGTVSSNQNAATGTWNIQGNKIEIRWDGISIGNSFRRPLAAKGVRGDSSSGDTLRAKKLK